MRRIKFALMLACLMAIFSGLQASVKLWSDEHTLVWLSAHPSLIKDLQLRFGNTMDKSRFADALHHQMQLTMLRTVEGVLWYFLIAALIAYAVWRLKNSN